MSCSACVPLGYVLERFEIVSSRDHQGKEEAVTVSTKDRGNA